MSFQSSDLAQWTSQLGFAIRDSNRSAVSSLLLQFYTAGLFHTIASRVHMAMGNPTAVDVDDLANELWLRLQEKIWLYDPGSASFMGWAIALTRNLLIDLLRRRKDPASSDVEEQNLADHDRPVPQLVALKEAEEIRSRPFSDADWQQICQWVEENLRDALLVLVGFDLVELLARDHQVERRWEWRRWFASVGIERPVEFFEKLKSDCEPHQRSARIRLFAEYIDAPVENLNAQWCRKQHMAVELQAFWQLWLNTDHKFSMRQTDALTNTPTSDRVPVLCIDRAWPRSRSHQEWMAFRSDFKFRGRPPLLRFLGDSGFEERLNLFANSIHGDSQSNVVMLLELLSRNESLRNLLEA